MTTATFSTLGVPAPLVAALTADGKTEPFPIQRDTLPDTLAGRDVLGRGKTGSGKTLAFSLPMVARLAERRHQRGGRPAGLVLAPTRELATQIAAVIEPLAAAYDLAVTTIFGGVKQTRQVEALNRGVDIVVACPGRLEDLMQQGHVTLDAVEITVLDEADHMADLGFLPSVTRILNKTPDGGQRLLFSATLDNGVDKLVSRFLRDEVLHSVDSASSPVAAMTHHVFEVPAGDKAALVRMLASGLGRRILFTRTKHQAKKLAKQLTASGIPSVDLHGNLSQPARDRNLAAFAAGEARVLVATDVAARGVHVDDVELVVHVDPPMEHKAYLHRSGRTARAGSAGDVVTVMLPEQRRDTELLLRKAGIRVAAQPVTAVSDAVTALVGEVAPHVEPAAAQPQQPGRSTGANAQRKRAARGAGERPRTDRSGRPAAGSGRSGRSSDRVSHQSGRGAAAAAPRAERSERAARPAEAPARGRGGKGRAQSGPIRVGQVVRPNGGNRRSGR